MMPPANRPVSELSEETGISAVTLYAWRKQARAARAVVIRDVPPNCLAAGNAARILRQGVTGCNDIGSGVTVPKKGETPDYPNITACAKRLKNAREEFKSETQVTLTANPGVDYKTIIDVMDALRSDGQDELFPDVHFGVAR